MEKENTATPAQPAITRNEIISALETLKKYKAGKSALDRKIITNEQWWRMRHWGEIEQDDADSGRARPVSAWLFNSIANKHADAMDNIPQPTILPREQSDTAAAEELNMLVPAVLDRAGYEKLYSEGWWYKLKNGAMCQAVMWDPLLENGAGDIAIKNIDLLNLFWEPGIKDIQDSRNVFYVSLEDTDILKREYPEISGIGSGDTVNIVRYKYDDNVDVSGKTAVIDWYYKIREDGRVKLHYCRFAGDTVLYASENDPTLINGFYEHGRYPFIIDPLFRVEGSPCGFGYIDVMRDAQMYIDKLGQVILEHTVQMSRKRFFIKQNSAVREEEFADWRKPFVHVAGSVSADDIREIKLDPLDGAVIHTLESKINELKETSGNRDFQQGGTAGGVTAASAIAALQEAGNKLSRDMLKNTYCAYEELCCLIIELIRQFYDAPRSFRITGAAHDDGGEKYAWFDNSLIKETEKEEFFGAYLKSRRPVFDIKCHAGKKSPFSKAAQNELAKELYSMGFFNPALKSQSLAALDMMDFEGKEGVRKMIEAMQPENKEAT